MAALAASDPLGAPCEWTVAGERAMCLNLPPATEAGDWMQTEVQAEATLIGG
jgi:hypothetical protein